MKTYKLQLTSAIVIGGNIARAGSLVDLDEATAKNLLARGRAVLVSAPEPKAPAPLDLSKANRKKLLEIAGEKGLTVPEKATNKEIAEMILAAESADEDDFDALGED